MKYAKALKEIQTFLRPLTQTKQIVLISLGGELVFVTEITDQHFEKFINEAVKLNYIQICLVGQNAYFQITQEGETLVGG